MGAAFVTASLSIPTSEISVSFSRSSGPGGQNVNKVESKVELRWNLWHSTAINIQDRAWLLTRIGKKLTGEGDLVVTSSLTRDQGKNRQDAMDKLVALLRAALARPVPRRKTQPTRGARERRLDAKKQQSERKQRRGRGDY
jgi:ribosome-associated protein